MRHSVHGQFRQLEHLAGLGYGVFAQFQVADAAMGVALVLNSRIDVGTLAQGVCQTRRSTEACWSFGY